MSYNHGPLLKTMRLSMVCALALVSCLTMASAARWPTLTESKDAKLQRYLESELESLGLSGAVREKRLAVALVELSNPHKPRYAAVNPNLGIYAASLPKIAILLGVFQDAADNGTMPDGETLDLCIAMIRKSSNSAATTLLNRIGFEYLSEVLQSERYALYDEERAGGLWVGKAYASTRAWRRDPIHNLSHGATVHQVARFYYLLETGRLVSPAASASMKVILGEPAIRHKFVEGLGRTAPHADIFRKSGTWREWHADSAIVEHDGKRYVAVAIARDRRGGEWLSDIIVALDGIVHAGNGVG
jgi:beta-lactamase class A